MRSIEHTANHQLIDLKRFFAVFPCKSPALTGDARNLLKRHANSQHRVAAVQQKRFIAGVAASSPGSVRAIHSAARAIRVADR
jgi:hypothetical protein